MQLIAEIAGLTLWLERDIFLIPARILYVLINSLPTLNIISELYGDISMIMADVLAYFLVITGMYIVFISYWLMTEALFSGLVERCRLKYEESPVKSTIKGLAIAIPIILVCFVLVTLMGNPIAHICGIGLIIAMVMLGLVGSTGLCRQIGRGLGTPRDESQPWRRVLRGGLVLGLTFNLPIVGWFVVMPWAIISGLGVFVQARPPLRTILETKA